MYEKSIAAGLSSKELPRIIPIFDDNYIFLIELHEISPNETKKFIIVDPGESQKIEDYLNSIENKNIELKIFITHHHPDHIGGLKNLVKNFNCEVWAPKISENKIPEANHYLSGNEMISIGKYCFATKHLPGHTLDHLVYYEQQFNWLFVGDVLFNFGCGRLFEGDYNTAFDSLQLLKKYDKDTIVFCTHEYTEKNILFALHKAQTENNTQWLERLQIENNKISALRKNKQPTVPFLLKDDIENNPFLRARTVDQFKTLRIERNLF